MSNYDFLNIINHAPAEPAVCANAEFHLPTTGLPKEFVGIVEHIARVYSVPTDFVLLAALTTVGAAIGGNVKFKVFSHENRPCIWLMVIAKSGAGKSAPMRELLKPLQAIDQTKIREYRKALAKWKESESQLKKGDVHLPKPIAEQVLCGKSTGAAREQFLNDNQRGALLYRDELRGFFNDLNSYGGTSDIEDMLSIYQSEPLKVDRVSDNNLRYADAPFMPIMGGIQTSVMRETFCNDFIKNGFFSRFAVIYFEPKGICSLSDDVSNDIREMWANMINKAYGIGCDDITISATPEGKEAYRTCYDKLQAEAYKENAERDENYNEYKATAISKVAFIVARLALIAHVLLHVDSETLPPIDADTIKWAYSCAPYLCNSQMQAYDIITGYRHKKEMSVAEIYQEVDKLCERRGITLNQSKFAEVVGDSQPNISRAINKK